MDKQSAWCRMRSMKTYKLNLLAHQRTLDNLVIQLRRDGFSAWRDSEFLHTDASVADIGFASGNALRVIVI